MIIGFFINQYMFNQDTRTHHILRAIIYLIIAGLTFSIIGVVEADSSPETQIYRDVTDWLMIGVVFAFVAAIFNMILAFGGGAAEGAGTIRSWFGGERPATAGGAAAPAAPAAPGATPTPPVPPNPAEVQRLEREIEAFVNAVGHPPAGPPPTPAAGPPPAPAAGMWTVLEIAIQRYRTEIEPPTVPDPVKRTNAQAHMAVLDRLHADIEAQRNRMETVLGSPQYIHVGQPYQQAFEQHIMFLLQLEIPFTQLYHSTLRWL